MTDSVKKSSDEAATQVCDKSLKILCTGGHVNTGEFQTETPPDRALSVS